MAKPFQGDIKLDIRDSTPDWSAFLADRAPEGAPNVLVVLYDDTGCAVANDIGKRGLVPYEADYFFYKEKAGRPSSD